MIKPVWYENNAVHMIDQTLLPGEYVVHKYTEAEDIAQSIENMVVRGAPAIGISAAFGLAMAAKSLAKLNGEQRHLAFIKSCDRFSRTRPTAVNLFWAIDQMQQVENTLIDAPGEVYGTKLLQKAQAIHDEDIQACITMGEHGKHLLPAQGGVLTHCNAGALATGAWGTALGVIRSAIQSGHNIHVYSDETRPFLQGSRLTMWELMEDKIPCTLLTDNMAAHVMKQGKIQAVIVGADRIAANGDVANKIGTYQVAIAAKYHHIPFFVAAPLSTLDLKTKHGNDIVIEERSKNEVTSVRNQMLAPAKADALHPAFDVTPSELVTAIITEKGVVQAPYEQGLAKLFDKA